MSQTSRFLVAGRDARDGCRQEIAAAWHGLDDALVAVAECLANIADASGERIVTDNYVAPDRLDDLVLGEQLPSPLDEAT